jgi:hypothetical protein
MGLGIGSAVIIVTVAFWLFAQFARGMSTAPSQEPIIGLTPLVIGVVCGALLIASHYYTIPWSW